MDISLPMSKMGRGVAKWLRRCASSRTVTGSIPGGVTGFFSDISPSNRTLALGLTQPLVKMSTRNIPGGKGGRCVRLTTSPASRSECHRIWEPKPPGTLWATPGLLPDCFTCVKNSFNKWMKISRLRVEVQSLRIVCWGYNTQPVNMVFIGVECRNMIAKASGNVKTTVF
jgi:hypothetical protein